MRKEFIFQSLKFRYRQSDFLAAFAPVRMVSRIEIQIQLSVIDFRIAGIDMTAHPRQVRIGCQQRLLFEVLPLHAIRRCKLLNAQKGMRE